MSEIYEHEIPNGSKLYFGESAQIKRKIERSASAILEKRGFSEIVTPYFSYHQHLSLEPRKLLRFSDVNNHEISLRADSTIDVVRIATRRIKDENIKKWFYIQPVFKYPSDEFYQIGAETLDSADLSEFIEISKEVFCEFTLTPTLQISNIEIPKILCEMLDLPISVFEKGRLEMLLNLDLDWLNKLAVLNDVSDIDAILKIVPKELKNPLKAMQELGNSSSWSKVAYAPLYYSKMRYYDKLFFRFLCDNSILSGGGGYEVESRSCAGFAIFTDALIEKLANKEK